LESNFSDTAVVTSRKGLAMPLDFYYTIASPPCRSVLMLAKTLGLQLNLKKVDLLKKEQYTPEFLEVSGTTCRHAYYLKLGDIICKETGLRVAETSFVLFAQVRAYFHATVLQTCRLRRCLVTIDTSTSQRVT
jgi:hypothetical protein